MEDAGEPSASSSDGPKEVIPVKRKLLRRFSNSFSSDEFDLDELDEAEEEEEEEEEAEEEAVAEAEACIEDSSPGEVVEDGSFSLEPEILCKEGIIDCLQYESASAPASSKVTTSGSNGLPDHLVAQHWRYFHRVFKKGHAMSQAINAKRMQALPPVNVKRVIPRLARRTVQKARGQAQQPLAPLDGEMCYFKSSWKNFSLCELQAATDNFSHENLIGQGGYAEVYKGRLEDGQVVAIKRLTRGCPEEMTVDFLSELGIMVHVDHPNVARLIGYGVEGGMHLVLPLSAHGSLASLLYGPKEKLNWGSRYKIALGTAEGLLYLHEECQRRIIHKDIKAANILLSEDFDPQISDFGLSKWLPEEWTHHTVEKIEGTFGYLPPEFFTHGIVDEKTDVYAYGVLVLELVTGRQALDSSQQSLVMWAKPLIVKNNVKELVDPTITDAYDCKQMDQLVCTAYMCVHHSSMQRPDMSQVVQVLKGDEESLKMMKEQLNPKHQRTYSEELGDAEEYNSTKCLTDLNQHLDIPSSEELSSVDYLNNRNRLMQLAFDHAEI